MRKTALAITFVVCCSAFGQQPNTPAASLLPNGVNGPPFPIVATVESNNPATALSQGGPSLPYAIVQSATGQLEPGAATFAGGSFDLPLTPEPFVVVDGFKPGSPFHTNASGIASATATYPLPDVGSTFAYQVLLADPLAPGGYTLSAAVGATIVHAATTTTLSLSAGPALILTSPVPIPFFGANYTQIGFSSCGWISFGPGALQCGSPTNQEFTFGPPRIAGYWSGTDGATGGPTSVIATYDLTSTAAAPGFVSIGYTTMPGIPGAHPVVVEIYFNGVIRIIHGVNNGGQNAGVGITPGQNMPGSPKDLSSLLAPNSYAGAVGESIFETFGISGFDLAGKTLTFIPMGPGPLPQSTNRYLVY